MKFNTSFFVLFAAFCFQASASVPIISYGSCAGLGGSYDNSAVRNYAVTEILEETIIVTWLDKTSGEELAQAEYKLLNNGRRFIRGFNSVAAIFRRGSTPWKETTPYLLGNFPAAGDRYRTANISFARSRYGNGAFGYLSMRCE